MLLHLLSKRVVFEFSGSKKSLERMRVAEKISGPLEVWQMSWYDLLYGREQKKLMLLEGPGVLLLVRRRPSKSYIGQTGDGT